ncbi:hypothetical protein [Flavobacterium anhuiense]|uniref:hypothetical protein n=1 Tax=Flavobacterium anhuiense TaxID=459526 RepID=UPI000E6BBD02|nr:hypothetical protein [Flavobacterium anhuiense]
MIINKNTDLFRYDLQVPPKNWGSEFFNEEYFFEGLGHKNKAKLYFFTDSPAIANSLGQTACCEKECEYYYLPTLRTTEPLRLIDFSRCISIFQMLCTLQDLNIDVLTDQFRTFENENTFLQLRTIFENISQEPDTQKKISLIYSLKVHSQGQYSDVGLFGQRLTDFENGIKFRQIIKEIYPDADGYIWREFNDPRGLSYCLFDSEKLSEKLSISLIYI